MRNEAQTNRAIEKYSDTVKRICMVHLKNHHDTQDIFQDVYLKYMLSNTVFESDEHEKAWFIRVTINACKDLLKSFFHTKALPLEELSELTEEMSEDTSEVLEAVLSLDEKYKNAVYLVYYEGYSAIEASRILNQNINTVYTALSRAKQMLREKLGGDNSFE